MIPEEIDEGVATPEGRAFLRFIIGFLGLVFILCLVMMVRAE